MSNKNVNDLIQMMNSILQNVNKEKKDEIMSGKLGCICFCQFEFESFSALLPIVPQRERVSFLETCHASSNLIKSQIAKLKEANVVKRIDKCESDLIFYEFLVIQISIEVISLQHFISLIAVQNVAVKTYLIDHLAVHLLHVMIVGERSFGSNQSIVFVQCD